MKHLTLIFTIDIKIRLLNNQVANNRNNKSINCYSIHLFSVHTKRREMTLGLLHMHQMNNTNEGKKNCQ